MHSFLHRLPGLCLVVAVVACGGEQKPTAPDAKVPEKTAAAPAKPPEADNKVKVVEGANPTEDRYALKIDPSRARSGRRTRCW
jgi:hypothetical protein